jgi:hypothetical protein
MPTTGIHIRSNVQELYYAFQAHLKELGVIDGRVAWGKESITAGLFFEKDSNQRFFTTKPAPPPSNYQHFLLPRDWDEAVEACKQMLAKRPENYVLEGSNGKFTIVIGHSDKDHVHVLEERKEIEVSHIRQLTADHHLFPGTKWKIIYHEVHIGCLQNIRQGALLKMLEQHDKWWNKT